MNDRLSRCYELAAKRITETHPTPDKAHLVHGIIRNKVGDVAHAWIELPDTNIWEPISNTVYDVFGFRAIFRPIELARYTPEEMRELILENEHWGPWDDVSLFWADEYDADLPHVVASKNATEKVIDEYFEV